MKLGSLFDGSGGFPLAGSLCGIEPVWAAEVEPYPIAVTTSRFPKMRHLGSVTDIDGAKVEPVDIITFGSPCQDLSVAGKRAGLKHEANGDEETTRSGLFMEAVRIIREMREATNGRYPTFTLWENVPGAFSSNKGEDFHTVLEELVKIVEPSAVMPPVPKNGWPYADCYMGDGWSLAYRVFDAQYWGVPQRRRRIHLVLHLTGQCAGRVLFEREGLRGHLAESGTAGQTVAGDVEDRTGAADCAGGFIAAGFKPNQGAKAQGIGWENEVAPTILAGQEPAVCYSAEIHPADSHVNIDTSGKAKTLTSRMGTGGGNVPMVMEEQPVYCMQGNGIDRADTADCEGAVGLDIYNLAVTGDVATTLTTATGQGASNTGPSIMQPIAVATQQGGAEITENSICPTITAAAGMNGNNQPWICTQQTYQKVTGPLMANGHPGSYTGQDAFSDMLVAGPEPIVFDKEVYNSGENATGAHYISEGGPAPSLRTEHPPGVCAQFIVRRLTPTECARLQGFPDNWGHPVWKEALTEQEYAFWLNVRNTHAAINGKAVKEYTKDQMLAWYNKLHTDSSEYKMWGNGIALPPALYVMEGIAETERMTT